MGLFSRRARSSASRPHGYHSTGLCACFLRYGLVSEAGWLVYFSVPSLFKCLVCVILPCPTLVAWALAVLKLKHVDRAQSGSTAEGGEIGDSDGRAAGRDKSFVHDSRYSLFAAHVRPSPMRQDSSAGNRGHVRVVEAVLATKGGQVADRTYMLSVRIDKSFMCLDELTLA